jgi:hypothetical protein
MVETATSRKLAVQATDTYHLNNGWLFSGVPMTHWDSYEKMLVFHGYTIKN